MKEIRAVLFSAAACLVFTSSANAQSAEEAGHVLLACYKANAVTYGSATCQSPSSIVGAVYGMCAKEEHAVWLAGNKLHPELGDFGDSLIDSMHSEAAQLIQSWFLNSQIKTRKCP